MKWKSEYETGVGEIDGQHRTIMQMVTEFEAAVKSGANWNSLHPLIARAKEYAKFHFAVEESLMQIFEYPRLVAHRAEHQFVLERVAALEVGVLRKGATTDLVAQFRNWLLGHFLESDRHFIKFIDETKARTEATTPKRGATRVLIVEPDEENRNLLRMLLEANDYQVTLADDGAQALATARSDPPDAVVSEVLMPNMDGFALCRTWMQDAALSSIPFIFCSGHYVRPDAEQFALSLGAACYFDKPVQAKTFLRELRAASQKPERGESAA